MAREVVKMERKFHLIHITEENGRVIEDREAYFHGAEFRLGCFVFLSETVNRFKEFAEVGDKLDMHFRNESWSIKRLN